MSSAPLRIFLLLHLVASHLSAQSPDEVVRLFFVAMQEADTTYLDHIMADDILLYSTQAGQVSTSTKADLLRGVRTSTPGMLDERVYNITVQQDHGLATAWMDYQFYYGGALTHCGANTFTLARRDTSWQVISIADSRHSTCRTPTTVTIDSLLTAWHLAATIADSAGYFSLLSPSSTYVGTDASEVWTKEAFLGFAAPYFARGKAWAFTTRSRNIYTSRDGHTVWFDEVLDTWMGACRGSGVWSWYNGHWLLDHYVLSVAVSNDAINDYLELIGKER